MGKLQLVTTKTKKLKKMSDRNISVSLFRVSADSKFLDMVFDCPREYHFTYLQLETRTLNDDGKFVSQWFDLSKALFTEETKTKHHWTVRLPLNKIGINSPAIYIATLKAQYPDWEAIETTEEIEPDEITDEMICSDVNDAYYYLLDNVLNVIDKCSGISDDAIRNYLILYAHIAALQQHDLDVAEVYFKLIINKFEKCPRNGRPDRIHTSSCNCGRR